MDDKEFLNYCAKVAKSPRCGITTSQIARLLRLAGRNKEADAWDNKRETIVCGRQEAIVELVESAQRIFQAQKESESVITTRSF
jgi:hypothetical protein